MCSSDLGVALEPDSIGPRRLLARTLQDAKRFREADAEWRALAEKLPAEPGVWLELGACRELAGDFDGAIAAGREAIQRAPDWPSACNFLGYVLADHHGDLVESRRLIEKALAADPDNGAYVDSHGWLLFREGRIAEARTQLERAIELTHGDSVVHEHLGDTYVQLGLTDLARRAYQAAKDAGGTNAASAAAKLRTLR